MSRCRPILWLPMALPIGVSTGFISVAIANALARGGLAESTTGDVVASFFLALTFGVLWGPAIDASLSRRLWVLIGVVLTAAGLVAITMHRSGASEARVLSVIAFVTGTGSIIVGLASKGIAAHVLSMDDRALAGAWYAAGNLASASVAGAVGVWLLASTPSRWPIAIAVAASVSLALVAAAKLPREPIQSASGVGSRTVASLVDVWTMLRGAKGKIALTLCVVPFGTGAAINLMASVAPQWNATPAVVSTAVAISAPICALAALAGGWICVRLGIWRTFVLLGCILAGTALAVIPLPHSGAFFVLAYIVYALVQSAIFSAFYAVVFDTAGQGAASTKMGVFLSLSNLPYWYVALIEGRAVDRWGIAGLFLSDGLLGFAGLVVVVWLARRVRLALWHSTGAHFAAGPTASDSCRAGVSLE
jgi:MFS transporter, PAT family, beta-lactamase induction signal transducer AmpG